jgi:hypothetical protein
MHRLLARPMQQLAARAGLPRAVRAGFFSRMDKARRVISIMFYGQAAVG